MKIAFPALLASVFLWGGCAALSEFDRKVVYGPDYRERAEAPADRSPAAGAETTLSLGSGKKMIFGGESHRTYLGCLTCSKYEADSILNSYGEHGSKYATESIFNVYGDFGSKYSNFSPCNPYATDPPVIVDDQGNFLGRLTVNRYHAQATRVGDLAVWIAGVCAGR